MQRLNSFMSSHLGHVCSWRSLSHRHSISTLPSISRVHHIQIHSGVYRGLIESHGLLCCVCFGIINPAERNCSIVHFPSAAVHLISLPLCLSLSLLHLSSHLLFLFLFYFLSPSLYLSRGSSKNTYLLSPYRHRMPPSPPDHSLSAGLPPQEQHRRRRRSCLLPTLHR